MWLCDFVIVICYKLYLLQVGILGLRTTESKRTAAHPCVLDSGLIRPMYPFLTTPIGICLLLIRFITYLDLGTTLKTPGRRSKKKVLRNE